MTNEEAIEILEERWRYSRTYKYTDAEIREAFDMAIEALKQQTKGKWEYVQYDYNPNIGNWHCSECRFMFVMSGVPEYKYCPNCGARMTESEEKE